MKDVLERKPIDFERKEGDQLFDFSRTKKIFKINRVKFRRKKKNTSSLLLDENDKPKA